MHPNNLAIEVVDLHKSFGTVEAVRGIDLQVKPGEIFALLGPNGAGKTTIIEMLEGFVSPTAGRMRVLDHDPSRHERAYREKIGIVLQETEVEPLLSVEESIELVRSYYPNPLPLEEVLSATGLHAMRRVRPRKLSGGQRRRLDVALGLAGNPSLLFLDEPTTGFDPRARREAWDMIRKLKSLGKTILLTSHYMDEVEYVADRASILVQGLIVAEGTPGELARASKTKITFRLEAEKDLPQSLKDQVGLVGSRYEFATPEPVQMLHVLTGWALANHIELQDLHIERQSLEDAYVQLTQDTN